MSRLTLATIAAVVTACSQPSSGPASPTPPPTADAAPVAEPTPAPADAAPAAPTPDQLLAAEMAAYQAAKPVFDEYCAHCHTTPDKPPSKSRAEALKHFTMDSYPFGGHHAHELGGEIRHVLGVDGSEPTMPADDEGGLSDDELALIVRWSEAFDAAAAAGAGHHADHAGGHDHQH